MSWTILGVNKWSANDASDGLPIAGTRAWPSGANTAGDVGVLVLAAKEGTSPPSGLGDWTLVDSFTGGNTDSIGLRNTWVYRHVRGGSNPGMPADWATSYNGTICAWRHSSETSFTFGTPVQANDNTLGTTIALSAGVSSAGTDSLVVLVANNGRDNATAISSTAPATGVSGGTIDSSTAPSSSAWYKRSRSGSTGNDTTLADAVLDSGSTGAITVTVASNSVGVNIAFTILPGSGSDSTAPVLSSPTGTQTGSTTATIGATTDEGNGTLYGFVSTSATPPSDADLKAGTGAVWAGSVSVSSTGAKTLNATGLTASTGYYAHLLHTDAAANDSNTVTSAQFTTSAPSVIPIVPVRAFRPAILNH